MTSPPQPRWPAFGEPSPHGLEHPANPSGNPPAAGESGAESGAVGAPNGPANPQPAPQPDPAIATMIDALACLPDADRQAVIDHVAALAKLTPGKRAAILTLTRE